MKRLTFSSIARRDGGLRILDLAAPNWLGKLSTMLGPPFFSGMTGQTYRGEYAFMETLQLARAELGAMTAVVQPYVSTDWSEEYSDLYSRIFYEVPRTAQRIHFFRRSRPSLTYNNLRRLPDAVVEAYLGYMVVRPLGGFRVGDTVLASPWTLPATEAELVHCSCEFHPHLLGNRLAVRGMPFIQQDTSVGRCAQADVWMVARYLNRQMAAKRYRPAEISELARKTGALGPPPEGLNEYQMVDAFRQMGLNPTCLYITDAPEATEFIYTCVESGMPVIAGIPEHVVVVIGHDYRSPMSLSGKMHSMSETVEHFIAHDDANGPYRKMKVGEAREKTKGGKTVKLLTLDGQKVDFCLVVMPPRVHLTAEDVWDAAGLWVGMVRGHVADTMGISKNKLRRWPSKLSDLVLRVYLRLSSEFKEDLIRDSDGQQRNDVITAKYLSMRMPRYVWLVELARRSDLNGKPPHERLIRGELVLDSTGNRRLPEETLLAFQYDGAMYIPERPGRVAELMLTNQDPYRPLQRG